MRPGWASAFIGADQWQNGKQVPVSPGSLAKTKITFPSLIKLP
ncbi:MAG TPA: hypothetical protein VFJ18_14120 [Pararhizobium sp.]|nr:hypothetical protein [Pararhizobium sp.]